LDSVERRTVLDKIKQESSSPMPQDTQRPNSALDSAAPELTGSTRQAPLTKVVGSVLITLVVIGIFYNASLYSDKKPDAPPAQAAPDEYMKATPEYKLAVVEAGFAVPSGDRRIKAFRSLLERLETAYPDATGDQLGSAALSVQQSLRDQGITVDLQQLMQAGADVPRLGTESTYADALSLYASVRLEGKTHDQAIAALRAERARHGGI
jgi:hypothetical protein